MTFYELDNIDKIKKVNNNLDSIQMLRGIAALLVAFAHLHSVESKMGGSIIFGDWALNGFFGVDLFFVISGFIMVFISHNKKYSLKTIHNFIGLRLFRIYPLWWLVCGAVFIIYIIRPDLVYQNTINQPNILKSFLLLPQESLPLHAIGWTLINELYFYFVFSVFLLFKRKYLPYLLFIWGIISYVFAMFFYETERHPVILLILSPMNLEFIFGAFAALFYLEKINLNSKLLISIALVALFLISANNMPNPNENFNSQLYRALFYSIPCALLLLGLVNAEKNNFNPPHFLVFIGNISYSFYLIHVLIFSAIGRIAARFSSDGIIDNLFFSIIAIAITIFVSYISYRFFEKPIISFSHSLFNKKAGN